MVSKNRQSIKTSDNIHTVTEMLVTTTVQCS